MDIAFQTIKRVGIMYKLVFFVPVAQLEVVKSAVFAAGAGTIGDYEKCCWQVLGTGQFQPNEKASPYIGSANRLETIEEYRVEMVCATECIKEVMVALKQAHPYEEPAYDVTKLEVF